jgi:hypothetical protein
MDEVNILRNFGALSSRIFGDILSFMRFSVAYCILGIPGVEEWFLCVPFVELVLLVSLVLWVEGKKLGKYGDVVECAKLYSILTSLAIRFQLNGG